MNESPLLEVNGLTRHFDVSPPWLNRVLEGRPRQVVRAVQDVSFGIQRGETFSLVGESGCGKSTVARLVVGLYTPTSGHIRFEGADISQAKTRSARPDLQARMQMIFQDPYASLNPRWRVADIVAEPMRVQLARSDNGASDQLGPQRTQSEISERVTELLTQVGLSGADGEKFPHEFSGGQRQRISIARALGGSPHFMVCDEPTSALDVSVQAQILNLMRELQRDLGLTYLFISHDLAVVYHVSTRVGVMYLGRLVETAPTRVLFNRPLHPYTRMLLDAIPDLEMTGKKRIPVAGEVPSPIAQPSGCAFHPRCPLAIDICKQTRPELRKMDDSMVACHVV